MIYLLRHGKTFANDAGLVQTTSDTSMNSLTSESLSATIEVSKQLKTLDIDMILISPRKRCEQTIHNFYINSNIPLITVENLKEVDLSIFDNCKQTDTVLDSTFLTTLSEMSKSVDYPFNNSVESLRSVEKRIDHILSSLNKDKNYLIVSHGLFLACFQAYYITGNICNFEDFRMKNLELTVLN